LVCPRVHVHRIGYRLELARHGGGDPLSHSVSLGSLIEPGGGQGLSAFLALPSGTVADPNLAPFLQPASGGDGAQVLRFKGVATAME
jgi:hypothetical protein